MAFPPSLVCPKSSHASCSPHFVSLNTFFDSIRKWPDTLALLPRHSIGSRVFGCAAAQLQYDSDEDWEMEEDRVDPVLESEGVVKGRGVQWLVIGEAGANKHIFAERLAKLLVVPHISTGSLVRQELSPRSSLYKQEILDQVADIDLVLNFKCTENDLVKQHIRGRTYSPRGFQDFNHPGSASNNFRIQESENIHLCEEQNKPLEEYYKKQKKLIDVKVAGAPGDTWQHLMATLHLQHIDADRSTQKLTASFLLESQAVFPSGI